MESTSDRKYERIAGEQSGFRSFRVCTDKIFVLK